MKLLGYLGLIVLSQLAGCANELPRAGTQVPLRVTAHFPENTESETNPLAQKPTSLRDNFTGATLLSSTMNLDGTLSTTEPVYSPEKLTESGESRFVSKRALRWFNYRISAPSGVLTSGSTEITDRSQEELDAIEVQVPAGESIQIEMSFLQMDQLQDDAQALCASGLPVFARSWVAKDAFTPTESGEVALTFKEAGRSTLHMAALKIPSTAMKSPNPSEWKFGLRDGITGAVLMKEFCPAEVINTESLNADSTLVRMPLFSLPLRAHQMMVLGPNFKATVDTVNAIQSEFFAGLSGDALTQSSSLALKLGITAALEMSYANPESWGTARSSLSAIFPQPPVKTNTPPQFSASNVLSASSATTPLKISYDLLAKNFPGKDDSTQTLGYMITSLTNSVGKLYRIVSGIQVGITVPTTLMPADVIYWQPPTNPISSVPVQLFKMRLVDSDLAISEKELDVQALVPPPTTNTPPRVQTSSNQLSTQKDAPIVLSSSNGTSFTVTDIESKFLRVTLFVTNGLLKLNSLTGLTFTDGSPDNSIHVEFAGNLNDINTALNGLTYTPAAGFVGDDALTVTATEADTPVGETPLFGSMQINIAINDIAAPQAPVVNVSGASPDFTEMSPAVLVDDKITLTDADSVQLTSASVRISAGFSAGDAMGCSIQLKVTCSFNANAGILSLSGAANVSEFEATLRSVNFKSTSKNPTVNAATRTFTWSVSDGVNLSLPVTSTVRIVAQNDAPSVDSISAQSTTEDTPTTAIAVTVSDVDGPAQTCDSTYLSYTSGTTSVVAATGAVTWGGTWPNCTGTVAPYANASGTALITFTANDGSLTSAGQSFILTVNAVNDAPTVAAIANKTTNEDTATAAIAFTVSDVDGPAQSCNSTYLSYTSGMNSVVAATGAVTWGGTWPNCTAVIAPLPNANGTALITFTASDGTAISAGQSFTLTVNAVNDAPTVAAITNNTTYEDTATAAITVTVNDVDGPAQTCDSTYLSYTSGTASVVAATGAVTWGGTWPYCTAVISPLANSSGTSQITFTANDGTAISAGQSFTLTVNAVNDAPTLDAIASPQVTTQNTAKAVSFTANDVDGPLTCSATNLIYSSNNAYLVATTGAVVWSGAWPNCTGTVSPHANASGSAEITFFVSDGTLQASRTFTLSVTANVAPTVASIPSQSINEDTSAAIALTITDVDGPSQTCNSTYLTYTSGTPTVVADTGAVAWGGTWPNCTAVITPLPNANGTSLIMFTANDGTDISAGQVFTLTVNPVNDLPMLAAIAAQSTSEDKPSSAIAVTVSDIDGPTQTCNDSYFSYTSGTSTVVADTGAVTWSGTWPNCMAVIRPVANANGTSLITFTANDGTDAGPVSSFNFIVNAIPDAPKIVSIAPQSLSWSSPLNFDFEISDVDGVSEIGCNSAGVSALVGYGSAGTPSVVSAPPTITFTFSEFASTSTSRTCRAFIDTSSTIMGVFPVTFNVTDNTNKQSKVTFSLFLNQAIPSPTLALQSSVLTGLKPIISGSCNPMNNGGGYYATVVPRGSVHSVICDSYGVLEIKLLLPAGEEPVFVDVRSNANNSFSGFTFDRQPFLCPTGYVGVPASGIPQLGNQYASVNHTDGWLNVSKDFCVMKYPAKQGTLNGKTFAESRATGTPWTNIERGIVEIAPNSAFEACKTAGPGIRLISNTQWQTMARNAESVPVNWSGGSVGSGSLFRGHTDNTPSNPLENSSDDLNGYYLTDNSLTDSMGSGLEQRRTHVLSNGEVVWDIGGNVAQWVSDDVSELGVSPLFQLSETNFADPTYFPSAGINRLLLAPLSSFAITQFAGTVIGNLTVALVRGADFNRNSSGGIFTSWLQNSTTMKNSSVGFRCAFVPNQSHADTSGTPNSAPTTNVSTWTYPTTANANSPVTISYYEIINGTGATDANGDSIAVKIIALNSGTLQFNGTTYNTIGFFNQPLLVGPNDSLTWTPSSNASGNVLAFKIKLFDGTLESSEVPVSVAVAASGSNTAPTISNTAPVISGASANTVFALNYSSLISALGANDAETGVTGLALQVTQLFGGTLASSTSASCSTGLTYFATGLSLSISATNPYLCWTPPTGMSGNTTAFSVNLRDPSGLVSSTTAYVSITVSSGTNVAPTFLSGCRSATSSTTVTCSVTNAFGTTPSAWDVVKANTGLNTVTWTYEQLKRMTGVTDADSTSISFVVTSMNSGLVTGSATMRKGSVSMTTYTSGTPVASQLIGPGESVVYTAVSALTALIDTSAQLFSVRAWDGLTMSTTAIPINVVPRNGPNQNPTFSFSAPIRLTTIDTTTWNEISYAQVRDYTDAYDIDDPTRTNMRFLISGSLGANIQVQKKGVNACGSSMISITAGSTYLSPNESLCVMLDATSSSALSTPTNMLPVVNLRTIDWTGSANGSAAGTGNYIPLMIRGP